MTSRGIAIIGFAPETLDLSSFPGLTPEKVRADLQASADELKSKGFDAIQYFLDPDDFASTSSLRDDLSNNRFEVVLIGAGIRTIPKFTIYFEKLVNLIIQAKPDIRFCFNANPPDTVNAALRGLSDEH